MKNLLDQIKGQIDSFGKKIMLAGSSNKKRESDIAFPFFMEWGIPLIFLCAGRTSRSSA